jgi:ABC-2 type transport system ATP-binding protein
MSPVGLVKASCVKGSSREGPFVTIEEGMATILKAEGLTKYFRNQWNFRRFCVLHRLDLELREGEIFGLIGPNGAGKTTTFKLMVGLLRPSGGAVTFHGLPMDSSSRSSIGFLPEQPYFYDYLTVEESLHFYARLLGLPAAVRRERVQEVIDEVQLTPKRRSALRTLSKGTLQRVGIAQAILNRPRLVILDEPMSGLDPAGRHHLRELILAQQRAGATVLFSSHILPDAEALCDRVGILVGGRLRDILDLRRTNGPEAYLMTVSGIDGATIEAITRVAQASPAADGSRWLIRLGTVDSIGPALDLVRSGKGVVESLMPVHLSLEEHFLAHVGNVASLD